MTFSILQPDLPYALQVEITSHCNLSCGMCPLTTKGTHSSLAPGNLVKASRDQIVAMAREVRQVIIAGFGEPLLNTDCIALMRELDRHAVWISLATNGTPITPTIARELAAIRNLRHINVSIDSPDGALYRSIRGGDLERALKGLRNLMKCVANPDRVTVSSVAMASSIETLADFPALLAEIGVNRYILQGLVTYAGSDGESLLDSPAAANAMERLRTACAEAGVELVCPLHDRMDSEIAGDLVGFATYTGGNAAQSGDARTCMLPWEAPFIDKDGRVFACCYASAQRGAPLGDLRTEALDDVWNGSGYRKFRADILEGPTTPKVCRDCTVVPLGEHPLRYLSVELLLDRSVLRGTEMTLLARNTGSRPWKQADAIRIGTSNPRDHASPLATAGWLAANRVASFAEDEVPPGEVATFRFSVRGDAACLYDTFQLVADGKCWIPNSRFRIAALAARR